MPLRLGALVDAQGSQRFLPHRLRQCRHQMHHGRRPDGRCTGRSSTTGLSRSPDGSSAGSSTNRPRPRADTEARMELGRAVETWRYLLCLTQEWPEIGSSLFVGIAEVAL